MWCMPNNSPSKCSAKVTNFKMEAQRIAAVHLKLHKLYLKLSELQDEKNSLEVHILRAHCKKDSLGTIKNFQKRVNEIETEISQVNHEIQQETVSLERVNWSNNLQSFLAILHSDFSLKCPWTLILLIYLCWHDLCTLCTYKLFSM